MNGKPIPLQHTTKYLGIVIDKRLKWSLHTKYKRKIANRRLHLLKSMFKSNISLKNKISNYKSIIRPIWSYGMQMWGPFKPFNI